MSYMWVTLPVVCANWFDESPDVWSFDFGFLKCSSSMSTPTLWPAGTLMTNVLYDTPLKACGTKQIQNSSVTLRHSCCIACITSPVVSSFHSFVLSDLHILFFSFFLLRSIMLFQRRHMASKISLAPSGPLLAIWAQRSSKSMQIAVRFWCDDTASL